MHGPKMCDLPVFWLGSMWMCFRRRKLCNRGLNNINGGRLEHGHLALPMAPSTKTVESEIQ